MAARETKAARLSRLVDEIGYELGQGTFDEGKIREARWLWRTTPDAEKDDLRLTLHDIEDMVKTMREELDAASTKLPRFKVKTGVIDRETATT